MNTKRQIINKILIEALVDDPIEKDKKAAATAPYVPKTQAEKNREDFKKIVQEKPPETPEYTSVTRSETARPENNDAEPAPIEVIDNAKEKISYIPGSDPDYLSKITAGSAGYGKRTESVEKLKFTISESIIMNKLLNELTAAEQMAQANARMQGNQQRQRPVMNPQAREQRREQARAAAQKRNADNAARAAAEQAKLKSGELVTVKNPKTGMEVNLPPDLARQAQQQIAKQSIAPGAAPPPPTLSAPVKVSGASNVGSAGGVPRGEMTDTSDPNYDRNKDPRFNTAAAISNVNKFETPAEEAARRISAGNPETRFTGQGADAQSYGRAAAKNEVMDRAALDSFYRDNRERQRAATNATQQRSLSIDRSGLRL